MAQAQSNLSRSIYYARNQFGAPVRFGLHQTSINRVGSELNPTSFQPQVLGRINFVYFSSSRGERTHSFLSGSAAMQARRFVDLGRRLLASSRRALYPLPPECLRSVAFPVNPSILKPVCADVLPPALRNRPPGLEFCPSSHLLSVRL